MFKEFKEFATRGNMVDMAVGIIIGAAFGAIVNSFVGDILMPPIGALAGGVDFSQLKINLTADASLNYGMFIQTVVDFLIIALSVFFVVKVFNKLSRKEAAKKKDSKEVLLLKEIRDELKKAKLKAFYFD